MTVSRKSYGCQRLGSYFRRDGRTIRWNELIYCSAAQGGHTEVPALVDGEGLPLGHGKTSIISSQRGTLPRDRMASRQQLIRHCRKVRRRATVFFDLWTTDCRFHQKFRESYPGQRRRLHRRPPRVVKINKKQIARPEANTCTRRALVSFE